MRGTAGRADEQAAEQGASVRRCGRAHCGGGGRAGGGGDGGATSSVGEACARAVTGGERS